MKAIVPIFQLSRKEETIELSETFHSDVKDFGNGFFLSNDGLILSVAHVLSSDLGTDPYALINDKFQKITIIKKSFSKNPENFNDVAIGRIPFNSVNFVDVAQFDRVTHNSNLLIVGYSRMTLNNDGAVFDFQHTELSLVKLTVTCCDENYYEYIDNEMKCFHKLSNSFTVKAGHESFSGLSGSPVVLKSNQDVIVGILRGGKLLHNGHQLQVLHIGFIKDFIKNDNQA